MRAQAHTFKICSGRAVPTLIDVEVRAGKPSFAITDVSPAAARLTHESVRAAILYNDYQCPDGQITVSVDGPQPARPCPDNDLAVACALLAASDQIPTTGLASHGLYGGLGLGGQVIAGFEPQLVAYAARDHGLAAVVLALGACARAGLPPDVAVVGVTSLRAAAQLLALGAHHPEAMVTIRFTPQAWIRDQAIEVDAQGPHTFQVPAGDARDHAGDWLPGHSDASDALRDHANAPAWIRAWSGPFEIDIEHAPAGDPQPSGAR